MVNENQLPYIGLLVAYILVYVFLFFPNSEYVCFFLLMVLHGCFLAGVYLEDIGLSFPLFPFPLFGWEGYADLRYVFYVCAILLVVASVMMARMYQTLHDRFTVNQLPIDLGSIKNEDERDEIKYLMMAETLYLLCLTYVMHQDPTKVLGILEKYDMYNLLYLTSLGGILCSCMCIYLTDDLGKKTIAFMVKG